MSQRNSTPAEEEHGDSGDERATMEAVANEENLRRAFRRVCVNRGAPGVDGVSVHTLEGAFDDELPKVRTALLEGRFRPAAVRRVDIPKANGGTRTLGIPTVRDRWVQQALLQVLGPVFDPTFSDQSFGFRPGRSQHGALRDAENYLRDGLVQVVNIDLAKFFDTVQHDVLMVRVAKRVGDKRILTLIGRFLRAGMMEGGVMSPRVQGTPQGGPLSPLLSNILLDDLDQMLEQRGHRFVRYADDFLVFKRTERAAWRTKKSVTRFLNSRLKLDVNESKSGVSTPEDLVYLGYTFTVIRGEWSLDVSGKAVKRLRDRLRPDLRRRGRGRSIAETITAINRRLRGWFHYFKLSGSKYAFRQLDKWIRRRIRALTLRHWRKKLQARWNGLAALGVPRSLRKRLVSSRKGYWRLAIHPAMSVALPNKTLHGSMGLFSLLEAHEKCRKRC